MLRASVCHCFDYP